MLDKDKDGHLTEDDVISLSADVIETAFGHVPPGEVRKSLTIIDMSFYLLFVYLQTRRNLSFLGENPASPLNPECCFHPHKSLHLVT